MAVICPEDSTYGVVLQSDTDISMRVLHVNDAIEYAGGKVGYEVYDSHICHPLIHIYGCMYPI